MFNGNLGLNFAHIPPGDPDNPQHPAPVIQVPMNPMPYMFPGHAGMYASSAYPGYGNPIMAHPTFLASVPGYNYPMQGWPIQSHFAPNYAIPSLQPPPITQFPNPPVFGGNLPQAQLGMSNSGAVVAPTGFSGTSGTAAKPSGTRAAASNPVVANLPQPAASLHDYSDWPQHHEYREITVAESHLNRHWNFNKWAWRSQGSQTFQGSIKADHRWCLGVLRCSNLACKYRERPLTADKRRREQLLNSRCKVCNSSLLSVDCDAKSYFYEKTNSDGVKYLVWEHDGEHHHDRPPGGRISRHEQDQVDAQVSRNVNATVHSLRTGDLAPDSVPLGKITPSLANPRNARYQVMRSQTRLGIHTNLTGKGAFSFIRALRDLNSELDDKFLIDSSMSGPHYLMFQTPFMEKMLHECVESWDKDSSVPHIHGRHGMNTDGDHSYFRDGVLNVTCVFSSVMIAWVPVLYTWTLGQDTPSHQPHFRRLNDSILGFLDRTKRIFRREYLLHVFDFSLAQMAAHAAEYASAVSRTILGFTSLSSDAQAAELDVLRKDADSVKSGCEYHFMESVERLACNGAIIPAGEVSNFKKKIFIMRSKHTTYAQFIVIVDELSTSYPKIRSWILWWIRPTIACMIFPCCSTMEPSIQEKIPSTSNPSEHQHSLLHHAVGKDQDLIPGIKKLYLHVKEIERQYNAISEGHYAPANPRDKRAPKTARAWEVNDGRAPDTEEALTAANKATDLALVKAPFTLDISNPNHLASYRWYRPNSCFIDNGLELWFRAFCLWPAVTKSTFLSLVPHQSYLGSLFYHFQFRFDSLYVKKSPPAAYAQRLELMQTQTLSKISGQWDILKQDEHGCPITWLQKAINDGGPSFDLKSQFCVYHSITRVCESGHVQTSVNAALPLVEFRTYHRDLATAHSIYGKSVTFQQYLAHYIPRVSGGNYSQGTTPLHLLPGRQCEDPDCTCLSDTQILSITAHWPQILTVTAHHHADISLPEKSLSIYPNTLEILDHDGTLVLYELVGRQLIVNGNHFVSQLRFSGHTFTYDDMNGSLIPSSDKFLLEKPDVHSVCYVYHRSSTKFTVTRQIGDILHDYSRGVDRNPQTEPIEFDLDAGNAMDVDHQHVSIPKLRWFRDNIYRACDEPLSCFITCTLLECTTRYSRGRKSYLKENLASIKWPLRLSYRNYLEEIPYSNSALEATLWDAFPVVLDSLTRTTPDQTSLRVGDAILHFFAAYMDSADDDLTPSELDTFRQEFSRAFWMPLLDGDVYLVHKVLSHFPGHLSASDFVYSAADSRVMARVLLNTVVLRVYLNRGQQDDYQILLLAFRASKAEGLTRSPDDVLVPACFGQIERTLTAHEKILLLTEDPISGKSLIGHQLDPHAECGPVSAYALTETGDLYVFLNIPLALGLSSQALQARSREPTTKRKQRAKRKPMVEPAPATGLRRSLRNVKTTD